jgi:hypothetical protein
MASFAFMATCALAALTIAGLAARAHAHDAYDWIRKGGYVGVDGTRCCGKDDCEQVPAARIETASSGSAATPRRCAASSPRRPAAERAKARTRPGIDG